MLRRIEGAARLLLFLPTSRQFYYSFHNPGLRLCCSPFLDFHPLVSTCCKPRLLWYQDQNPPCAMKQFPESFQSSTPPMCVITYNFISCVKFIIFVLSDYHMSGRSAGYWLTRKTKIGFAFKDIYSNIRERLK